MVGLLSAQKDTHRAPVELGTRIRQERVAAGLTLGELASRAEFSESTLSRIENNKCEIGAHKLYRLADALGIDVGTLFGDAPQKMDMSRRSVSRGGEKPQFLTERFNARILCSDINAKLMHPFLNIVSARTLEEAGGCNPHEGEEFLFIVSGSIDLHMAQEEPIRLEEGDSLYFHGSRPHAYVNAAPLPSRILVVTSNGRATPSFGDQS
ncbi:MAG: XRE family transcriptional regulator [Pseudomonadota bacterium]